MTRRASKQVWGADGFEDFPSDLSTSVVVPNDFMTGSSRVLPSHPVSAHMEMDASSNSSSDSAAEQEDEERRPQNDGPTRSSKASRRPPAAAAAADDARGQTPSIAVNSDDSDSGSEVELEISPGPGDAEIAEFVEKHRLLVAALTR
jgi:hypothetical protein